MHDANLRSVHNEIRFFITVKTGLRPMYCNEPVDSGLLFACEPERFTEEHNFFLFIYNLNQQSEFTFYKLML
jgi:hypothetical protein